MTHFFDLLQSEVASDMAVSLLHTLWQGIVVAAVLFFVLKGISGRRSELRYRLSVFSLFAIVFCWMGTFSILQYEPPVVDEPVEAHQVATVESASTSVNNISASKTIDVTPVNSNRRSEDLTARIQTNGFQFSSIGVAGWSMLVWSAGVLVMMMRMFLLLAGAAKLKRDAVDIEDPALVELFSELCRRMGIRRRIRFAMSKTLAHPGVIGFWSPVLLVPMSILGEISINDLQAILAHELAHIRRFDYLVNFCQMVVETVLFFNPAVWWISRRIRIEREACCDIAGVNTSGQRIQYARLLFEQIANTASPQAAMAGFSDDNTASSEERINRIIHPQHKPRMKISWIKLMCWFGISGMVLLGLFKTTDVAIAMAVKIMSPAERVEVMKQISEDYTADTSLYAEDKIITVRGQLITEDGGELPYRTGEDCQGKESTRLDVQMDLRPYEEGCTGWSKIEADGSYEFQTRLKQFYIIVRPRNEYAVGFYGPFEFDPNEVVEHFDLPLFRGITGEILFVNEQNQPVENVQVTGGYPTPPDYSSWHHTIKAASGPDGAAVIEHAADELANFSCEAEGYVKEARQKIRLKPDEPYLWQLTSTPVTRVHVVSDANDQPVNGVGVNLRGKEYWQIDSYYIDRPANVTNDEGIIEFGSLSDTEPYLALVFAKGYQRQYVNIQGGDEIVVRLKEFQPVKGIITGDLNGLKQDENGSYFEFSNVVRTAKHSTHSDWSRDNKVYVEIQDDEAHFLIDKYYGHQVNIRLGSKTHKINIDEDDISNVKIDIPSPSSYEKKKITFTFLDAASSEILPLTGKFKLGYRDNPQDNYIKNHDIEIVDGKAEVEMVVPNHINWRPMPETGWFFYRGWKNISNDYSGSETIQCYPAGAIYGTIANPSDAYANVYMNIHTAKKSPLLLKNHTQNPIVDFEQNINLNPEGSYNIAPVPLEGEYAISVSHKNLYWLSEDIKLTEEKPIYEMDIILPTELADIQGQLLDPEKIPISGVDFQIHTRARHGGRTFNDANQSTDTDGCFKLQGFNPDRSIKYRITFNAPGYISKPYDLKIGEKNRIVLEKALVVEGTVFDKDTNQPLPGVKVYFWPRETEGYEHFNVKTNSQGRFIADRFTDAEYYYRLEKEGYTTIYSSSNTIKPSKDGDVKLYIQKQRNDGNK